MGFFLVVVAIIAVVVGVLNQMKAKKILAAPFKKTAEVAQNPQAGDAKGLVSCEGAIVAQQPLAAPCSGKPCVYYEVEVIRMWEKHVQTENGMKTEKGKDTVNTTKVGSHFYVNDGSGPAGVDARESLDCDMEQSFEQAQNVSYGDVVFGQFRTNVPHAGGDKHTTGVKAVEKIVPAAGNLFVMGKLVGGTVTKTDGMLGKLIASTKGREKLIGATKRNAMLGFIGGAVLMLPGGYFSIFGEPPVDNCANMTDQPAEMCTGHITNDSGETYDWTVTKPGTYTVAVLQPNVKIPIIPVLTITDASGTKVLAADQDAGDEVDKITTSFKEGKYTINVRDSVKGDAAKFQGGFSFSLSIKLDSAAAAPAASGAPAANTGGAATPTKPGTTKPGTTKPGTTKPGTTAAPTAAATAAPTAAATAAPTAAATAAPAANTGTAKAPAPTAPKAPLPKK
ncbi:MAG: hypothetical protein IT372_38075 [Polyangiaceae bacterium]|nr:hypothetical protein [Polyangiaceae bacterium]